MINNQRGALVIIISYSASPSRIIVLVKTHRKVLLLKREKKKERKGNKKRNEKVDKRAARVATERKRRQNLTDVSHCRAVFFVKLNETVQTALMRRKENTFWRIFAHNWSEICYMLAVSSKELF